MVKEVKNLTNIRLTESDTDGIWLHFDGGGKACGIALSTILSYGDIANEAIKAWAREQLDKQEISAQGCYEKARNIKHTEYEVLLMILHVLAKLESRR